MCSPAQGDHICSLSTWRPSRKAILSQGGRHQVHLGRIRDRTGHWEKLRTANLRPLPRELSSIYMLSDRDAVFNSTATTPSLLYPSNRELLKPSWSRVLCTVSWLSGAFPSQWPVRSHIYTAKTCLVTVILAQDHLSGRRPSEHM